MLDIPLVLRLSNDVYVICITQSLVVSCVLTGVLINLIKVFADNRLLALHIMPDWLGFGHLVGHSTCRHKYLIICQRAVSDTSTRVVWRLGVGRVQVRTSSRWLGRYEGAGHVATGFKLRLDGHAGAASLLNVYDIVLNFIGSWAGYFSRSILLVLALTYASHISILDPPRLTDTAIVAVWYLLWL